MKDNSNKPLLEWQQKLLDDVLETEDYINKESLRTQYIKLITNYLEEEWSKDTVNLYDFTDCPKCGDTKNRDSNFCPRCGYETGYCKHDELGYEQDGITLFCLKCKKIQITKLNDSEHNEQLERNDV